MSFGSSLLVNPHTYSVLFIYERGVLVTFYVSQQETSSIDAFFYKKPLYKESTSRMLKYLENLYY